MEKNCQKKKNYTTVIFDFDGTIYDIKKFNNIKDIETCRHFNINLKYYKEIINRLFKEWNKTISFNTRDEYLDYTITQILKGIGLNKTIKKEFTAFNEEVTANISRYTLPYELLKETLTYLKSRNVKVLLLTGGVRIIPSDVSKWIDFNHEQRKKEKINSLKGWGLLDYFDSVHTAYEFNSVKPFKEAFQGLVDRHSLTAEETIMIGDDWQDLCAKSLGMTTIWLNTEKKELPKIEGFTYSADYTADNYAQILEILKTII